MTARMGIQATGFIVALAAIIAGLMLLTAVAGGQDSSATSTTSHAGCSKVATSSNVIREITDFHGNTTGQLIEFTGYWDCSAAGGTTDTTDLVRWRLWYDYGPGNY